MMMVVLSVLYDIPELNLGFHFYLKSDNQDEEKSRLQNQPPDCSSHKYSKHVDEVESRATRSAPPVVTGTYQSFQEKDDAED